MQIKFSMKKSRSHASLSQFKSLDSIMSTVVNTEEKPLKPRQKLKATYSVNKTSLPSSKQTFENQARHSSRNFLSTRVPFTSKEKAYDHSESMKDLSLKLPLRID